MAFLIKEKKQYRWMYTNTSAYMLLQKNPDWVRDRNKYTEEDYTLTIRQLAQTDEGTYSVQCWNCPSHNAFCVSTSIELKLPETITSVFTTISGSSSSSSLNNTTIPVVAVSAVLTVLIISITVFLLLRKCHTKFHNSMTLRGQKSEVPPSVCFQRHEVEDNVYNEIDIELKLDYAKVADSTSLANTDHSPALPDRLEPSRDSFKSDHYTEVQDVQYSEIKSCISVTKRGIEADDYHENDSENDIAGAIYSLVSKTDRTHANQRRFDEALPPIDSATLTNGLGDDYTQSKGTDIDQLGVTYSKCVSKSLRRKSGEKRASRRDLQYAILDLAVPDSDVDGLLKQSSACQYSEIDFDQKAFVPPTRKPPSSWYKRRHKKTDT